MGIFEAVGVAVALAGFWTTKDEISSEANPLAAAFEAIKVSITEWAFVPISESYV